MTTDDAVADGTVPYREVSEPGYAERAAGTFVIENFGVGTSLLGGRCPRCDASIEVPLVDDVFRGDLSGRPGGVTRPGGTSRPGGPGGPDGPATRSRSVPIICTCTEVHPGRPADRVGCGAYWIFDVPAGS
ncbi:hypothetical protein [Kribbella sp. NPDC003557]|uniref:hypothetical protein n=1 Tax=Kribbella sp. NPDC003557 TaxID=3154449 RepID=UPI0033B4DB5A